MEKKKDPANSAGESLPRVIIIMSVYNAEKYLSEQIDSILAQRGTQVFLYIRDDGSCDQTPKILENYARNDHRVIFNRGTNLGAMKSFMQALFDCPLKGDFFGFGDADDVWVPEKLEYTIGFIEKIIRSHEAADSPVAASTKLMVVNERLERIGETPTPKLQLCFENALIETVTSGASIVMNKPAYDLIREYHPKRAVMHDAWVYLLITAFGIFDYGDRPTILYRQHNSNVTGTAHGFRATFCDKMATNPIVQSLLGASRRVCCFLSATTRTSQTKNPRRLSVLPQFVCQPFALRTVSISESPIDES